MISHPSLPEAVRVTLRRRILNNEIGAGERLREVVLAAELDVSRTTLRAALRDLKNEGLVNIVPRRGCFVARMSPVEVKDVCFVRYLLEAGAVCERKANVDSSLLSRLEKELAGMEAAADLGDVGGVFESDTRFHGLIAESGKRQRVADLWHSLDGEMSLLMRSSLDRQGIDLSEAATRHRILLDALRTRRRVTIEQAIKAHYLEPTLNHDTETP